MNKSIEKDKIIDLFEKKNKSKEFSIHTLIKERKLIVYGAGNGFIAFLNAIVNRYNILPTLIIDNKFKDTDTYNNIKARSLVNYTPREEEIESLVVVTVGDAKVYEAISKELSKKGFKNIVKSSDIFEFNLHHIPKELEENEEKFYLDNKSSILKTFDLFKDEESLNVFESVLRTYISHKPVEIPNKSVTEQYFPKDIKLNKGYARFINCGAYNGDTVKQSLKVNGKIDKLVCFEPDSQNFNSLSSYLKENSNEIANEIISFPCGVFSKEIQLSFSSDKLLCSSIFDQGDITIQCVSLDNVLPSFNPTFISMDVEGAEIEALNGARKLILENKPDLAISVYHFPNHLWEIPLFLNELQIGYKFYLRNYTGFTYETVLYATVGENDAK